MSILTPSLNQGRFIKDCLESVQNQTYKAIEHIVVDGVSSDQTISILKDAPNLSWISEPDHGQSHALNKAFAMSSGEIIGWVNSDDAYADCRAVAWAVEVLQRGNCCAVFGDALLINEANDVLQIMAALPFWTSLVKAVHYPVQPTFFFRRSFLEKEFVREDLRFVMDRDLMLRLAKAGSIKHLNRLIAVDRHQAGRKVLSKHFLAEVHSYNTSIGAAETVPMKLLSKIARILMRAMGVPKAFSLQNELQPAFPLRVPDRGELLRRQCLLPRHKMPFELPEAV